MSKITFEIVPSKNGQWHGRIVHANGKISFHGENVHNIQDLKDTIDNIKKGAADAEVKILPKNK